MKRKAVIFFAATALSLIMAVPAFAGTWKQDKFGWRYDNDDGTYQHDGWFQDPADSKWYFASNAGYILQNTWFGNYYLGSDGAMLTNTTTPDGYKVGADGAWIQDSSVNQPVQPGVFSATDVDNIMKTYANPAELASMKNYKDMFDNYIIPFAEANGYKVNKYVHVDEYADYELNLGNGKYYVWCQTYWHTGGDKVDDYSFCIKKVGDGDACIYPVGAVIGANRYPTIFGQYTSATAFQQLLLYLNNLSQ